MAKGKNNVSMLIYKDLHGVQVSNTAKTIAVGGNAALVLTWLICLLIFPCILIVYASILDCFPNLSPVKVTPCPVFPDDAGKQDNSGGEGPKEGM
jgi:hypothetical protein